MNDSAPAVSEDPAGTSPSARQTDASPSSRSLNMGGADQLSGFFTPVWENSRQGEQATVRTPPQEQRAEVADKDSKHNSSLKNRSLEHCDVAAPSLALEEPVELAPISQSDLLRRLRRTIRLYAPLPRELRAAAENHRLK